MSIRLQKLTNQKNDAKKNPPLVLISIGIGYIESILLFFILLLPYNFRSDMDLSGYIIWITMFLSLSIFYVRLTVSSLIKYYKIEKNIGKQFFLENGSIIVLFIILILFGYSYGFTTIADAIFYIASLTLAIPRFIIRHKRLAAYNEGKV